MDTHTPVTLRIGPAAARVGCSVWTLRRWALDGKVPVIRTPGGQLRFRPEDLDALITAR